jgi:hypothetical protein
MCTNTGVTTNGSVKTGEKRREMCLDSVSVDFNDFNDTVVCIHSFICIPHSEYQKHQI